ncbi:hypothetical protein D3C87_1804910 [compost metagenome]
MLPCAAVYAPTPLLALGSHIRASVPTSPKRVLTCCNWRTLTASVMSLPGARLVSLRKPPADPTDTSPAESTVPAKPKAT